MIFSSPSDPQVDGSLSFLDDFVSDALARGCAAYKPASQRSGRANRLVEEGIIILSLCSC